MVYNIFLIVIRTIISCSTLFGCKSIIDNQKNDSENQLIYKNVEKSDKQRSFTLSCGSGCAMTYQEIDIVTNKFSHRVKLNVSMYIDEELTEEYILTYIIDCQGIVGTSMMLENDTENILFSDSEQSKNVFQKYANQVCSDQR
ncbi:hypothetical protein [uncultured Aquimarina sp.]|uniref:hypothetical protein n=1 Tax=uncultured Aquimarina sp. TaxID=575652 RepID=UPI00261411B9|nr:hypothetical protein [uncultured Aquimarina sp.]